MDFLSSHIFCILFYNIRNRINVKLSDVREPIKSLNRMNLLSNTNDDFKIIQVQGILLKPELLYNAMHGLLRA